MDVQTSLNLQVPRVTLPEDGEPTNGDGVLDWLWPEEKDWRWYLAAGLVVVAAGLVLYSVFKR